MGLGVMVAHRLQEPRIPGKKCWGRRWEGSDVERQWRGREYGHTAPSYHTTRGGFLRACCNPALGGALRAIDTIFSYSSQGHG